MNKEEVTRQNLELGVFIIDCDDVYDKMRDKMDEDSFDALTESEQQELAAGHSTINLNGGDI